MGVELEYTDREIVVENMHLGDSLMILNCRVCRNMNAERSLGNEDEEVIADGNEQ